MQFLLALICSCFFHAYVPFFFLSICLVVIVFSISPSFSWIDCAWHSSVNPLCLETLFVLRHLLLILLLFTSSSVIRRLVRTFQRTSPTVVFIRNAMWFYRTFLILFYPLSFTVRDDNLYMRYLWDVRPWSFKSSTPTCTILILLYLNLLRRFEVHVS